MVKIYRSDEYAKVRAMKHLPFYIRYARETGWALGGVLVLATFGRFVYDLIAPTPSRPLIRLPSVERQYEAVYKRQLQREAVRQAMRDIDGPGKEN